MVSTVDHVASAFGVDLLRRGGSAADAAIGANAVLAVVAPHACGPGGDAWALVHDGSGAPHALDASGRAGSGADPDRVRAEGHSYIPLRGNIASVTVPGAVDGWLALHERFGRLPLDEILSEPIRLAEEGFTASPVLASVAHRVAGVEGNSDIPGDLRAGDLVTRPGSARALRAIVAEGRDGFFGGEFGEGLISLGNGEYIEDDLAEVQARWVDPLMVEVWGHQLWSVPPPSQGYLVLAGAWIADGLELPDDPADPLWAHLLVEAASYAGHDRLDVLHEEADGRALVDPQRLGPWRDAIDPQRASNLAVPVSGGGTTHVCAIDRDRMGVSLINSHASGFGAHLVAGSTGIFLHDRGIGFTLIPGHPAEYRPRRRPPHTLSPALVTRSDGHLRSVIGTMGGDAQPQILLQVLARHLHHGQCVGPSIGAGRWVLGPDDLRAGFETWRPETGRQVIVEGHAPEAWASALSDRGHKVVVERDMPGKFGHAHLIEVTDGGELAGCADPRSVVGVAIGL
jgi:gamma-glutamyltranspeptidase/glutathione hydrolase